MPRRPRFLATIGLIVALASLNSCTNPAAIAELNNQLELASDAVNDIRMNLAQMQGTIDSLTLVITKQDSSIAKLAVATNVQIIK